MSGKRNYFTEKKLYRWFSAMGEIKYGERLGHFVTFLKTNRTLILYIYFIYIYFCFRSWTRERNLKQLSRGLHGINRALNVCVFRETQRISRQNKGKNKKTKRCSFRWCRFLLVFFFSFFFFFFSSVFFDGPPGTAGLVTRHVYLVFGCGTTQTHTAASTFA